MLRESRAAKRARMSGAAAGMNPMMAGMAGVNPMMGGMNPVFASMFGGMPNQSQMSHMVPGMHGMPGMPGVAGMHDDMMSEGEEQEEATGSNGSQAGTVASTPAMPAAAVPAPAMPSSAMSEVGEESVAPPGAIEDFHSSLLPDAAISRSCTYLKNVPRNRLSDCLERMDKTLEATYTAELSTNGLLALLWIWTRMKPSVKVSDLRDLANITATTENN